VKKIYIKKNDASKWRDASRGYNPDTGSWQFELAADELPEGTNTIGIKAVDIFENEAETILTIKKEAGPEKEPSQNAIESLIDYFMNERQGNAVCGILLVIFIVIVLAVLSPRRGIQAADTGKETKKRKNR
jgi:hypothetical protein